MDRATLQEIGKIWDKINEIERKLSNFTENRHNESIAKIADTEEALCDIDERLEALVATADDTTIPEDDEPVETPDEDPVDDSEDVPVEDDTQPEVPTDEPENE